MDIFKVLLVYMAMTVTGATQLAPDTTPLPSTPIPAATEVVETITPAPSSAPAATPAPTPALQYDTLRPGASGEKVKKLQEKLKELGFYDATVDGDYGQKTRSAVSAFQKAHSLTVDGVAGNQTLSLLYSDQPLVTPTPGPTQAPTVKVPVSYMDKDTGKVLFSLEITCTGETTIYANDAHVPEGYLLAGDGEADITIRDGQPSPLTVIFYYVIPEA